MQIQRLTVEDSVESRIVMLQEKKANMINGTMNGDKSAMEKLTPEGMPKSPKSSTRTMY